MKTAISIPDPVFQSAEQLAERLGVSRSELYTKALAAMIEKHRNDLVTAQLNDVYGAGGTESALDPLLSAMQARALGRQKGRLKD